MWTRSAGFSERITEVFDKRDYSEGGGDESKVLSVMTLGKAVSATVEEDEDGNKSGVVNTSTNLFLRVVLGGFVGGLFMTCKWVVGVPEDDNTSMTLVSWGNMFAGWLSKMMSSFIAA